MKTRWDRALDKKENDKRMSLNEYVCFMIGMGYCSTLYYEFMSFIKNHRKNYPRKYSAWRTLKLDWLTYRKLDDYRYNV